MELRLRPPVGQTTGLPDHTTSSESAKLGRRPSLSSKEIKSETRARLANDREIVDWLDEEGRMGAILRYPDRVEVKVPAAIWDTWKPIGYDGGGDIVKCALREMPIYLMKFLRSNRNGEELIVREDNDLDIPGRHFIIETVDREGAHFLVTQSDQSDIAFAVTGYDAVCFQGQARYRLAGEVKPHTQYVSEMPRGMLDNWVYPQKIPSPQSAFLPGVRICPQDNPDLMDAYQDALPSVERGRIVRYHKNLASPSSLSYKVALLDS